MASPEWGGTGAYRCQFGTGEQVRAGVSPELAECQSSKMRRNRCMQEQVHRNRCVQTPSGMGRNRCAQVVFDVLRRRRSDFETETRTVCLSSVTCVDDVASRIAKVTGGSTLQG